MKKKIINSIHPLFLCHAVLEHKSIVFPCFFFGVLSINAFTVSSNFGWNVRAKRRYKKRSVTGNIEFHRKQTMKTKAHSPPLMLNDNGSLLREL